MLNYSAEKILPAQRAGGRYSASSILFLFPVSVLGVFFIFPVLSIFRNITFAGFIDTLQNPYYRSIISFTFLQAAVSTLSAILIGLPGAWLMSHLEFRGKRLVNSLTTLPFVLPSVLVVLGFVLCFGNSGVINSLLMKLLNTDKTPLRILYSFKAIIMAHTFYNFPICLRLVSSAWSQSGKSRIEAAQILGAGPVRIFRTVTLPVLMPAIIAAASLIFIFCFMSFAVILVLGGGPSFSTIEVEIYRLARISIDLEAAASLALAGAVITALLTYFYIKLQKKSAAGFSNDEAPIALRKFGCLSRPARLLMLLYLLLISLLIIGPLLAVAIRSFQSRAGWSGGLVFSLNAYKSAFSGRIAGSAIKNSLIFAFSSVLISIPAGIIAAYASVRKKIRFPEFSETMFMLPMGVSAVVIGLGYYSLSSIIPSASENRAVLIIFAHSVIALPFVVRTFTTGIQRINVSLIEASQTLGAGFAATFIRIELPLLKGSIISAAAFAFCISAGEINAALILSDGAIPTIPIAIYRLISSYNFFGACAMGTLLMFICGLAFYLIDRFGGSDIF
ncbi:MAG: iron ABC transporter permease [Spirochaetales bacterium]|nr:iron ABC transporter permease [Spirochaetales bacterium]